MNKDRKIKVPNLKDITKEVNFSDKDIKYNTPTIITYENRKFNINTNNYYEKIESTWKCEYYRRTKDKPKNKTRFCDATIKGIRDILNDKFNFYLKESHSDICEKIHKEEVIEIISNNTESFLSLSSGNISENSEISNITNISNKEEQESIKSENINIEKDYINSRDIKDLDEMVKQECLKNKKYLFNFTIFKKTFNKFYEKKNFTLKPNHLKYIYQKYNKICNNLTIDNLFEYCNTNNDIGIFCRDINITYIFDSKKKIFKHEHIIFFLEESIKRMIVSEYLLIDATFVFPENYAQTIIIMFYDNILKKMLPGIFIITNNKIYEGYLLIFSYIKRYLLTYINNEIINIKWLSYTTDFEIGLMKAFKQTFDFIPDLKHYGCFFHYMKNIYKYLLKNKYKTKENKKHYNYIIKNVYELPFKSNIDKNIEKEIKKICKKDKFYKGFQTYFIEQWEQYFQNKSLVLLNVHKKIRTNNSLENFNRIFKHIYQMEGHMNLTKYIDTLLEFAKAQLQFYKSELNSQQKKHIKSQNEINSESEEDNSDEIIQEIEKEINNESNSISDNETNNYNIENIEHSKQTKGCLDNTIAFINNYNSCSFDSFIILFINSILPLLEYNDISNKNYIYDNTQDNSFEKYINFISYIKKNLKDECIKFYDLYEKYNTKNNMDLFKLDKLEYKNFVPIVINYRLLNNNKIFGFIYRISHYCTGKCKYSAQLNEQLISKAFIDIPLVAYEDNRIDSIDKLFKEYIYMNIHTICNEQQCISEDDKNINFYIKKYEILELPFILSINTNLSTYDLLIKNKKFITRIFKRNIVLYGQKYTLIGFITQPYQNHFISYFVNYNKEYQISIKQWFKYDDMNGIIEKINNKVHSGIY